MTNYRNIAHTLERVADDGFVALKDIESKPDVPLEDIVSQYRGMLVLSLNAFRNLAKDLHRHEDALDEALHGVLHPETERRA